MSQAQSYRHRYEGPFWRRLFLVGVRYIPQPLQIASMPLWAGIFYGLVPSARRLVEANLDRVMGYAPPAVRHLRSFRLFVNYAQSITNLYALHLGQELPVEAAFDSEQRAKLLAILAQGRGAILVTGHLGFWSLGPYVMEYHGLPVPLLAMAEEPNRAVQAWEEQFRKKWRIVYTTGSPFASLELAATLRRGELVAMQLDRHLGSSYVRIPFFGAPAAFPLGPAMLGRVTRAPLVPVFMVREGARGLRVMLEEPIYVEHTRDRDSDLLEATTRAVNIYESYVRRYPYQWFNFHDFWATPEPTQAEDLEAGDGDALRRGARSG